MLDKKGLPAQPCHRLYPPMPTAYGERRVRKKQSKFILNTLSDNRTKLLNESRLMFID